LTLCERHHGNPMALCINFNFKGANHGKARHKNFRLGEVLWNKITPSLRLFSCLHSAVTLPTAVSGLITQYSRPFLPFSRHRSFNAEVANLLS
jgi:hypothetical protein